MSQTNPVSAALYTVLDTTKNVRIISIVASITWATTQPTLVVTVTIDGRTLTATHATPINKTDYHVNIYQAAAAGLQFATSPDAKAFLLEGRSVKVEVSSTWATTQPTPLVCRVKYAKIP